MNLRYRNDREDYVNHLYLIHSLQSASNRWSYYRSLAYPALIGIIGVLAALPDKPFVACVIMAAIILCLAPRASFSNQLRATAEAHASAIPEKEIELSLEQDGLRELIGGIHSFVPWTSVHCYHLFRDTIFIELDSALWAIIPQCSLAGDTQELFEIEARLKDKGIKKTENKI